MNWQLKTFEALTNTELYDILQLRSTIFVVEQNCVYLDLDGDDKLCNHLFLYKDHKLAAYCRIVPPGLHYSECSIGRVVCHHPLRSTQLGKQLMVEAIKICKNLYSNQAIQIGAQHYLLQFYSNLGFVQHSEIYLEDGIAHIKMIYP
jgi:ElaA protein